MLGEFKEKLKIDSARNDCQTIANLQKNVNVGFLEKLQRKLANTRQNYKNLKKIKSRYAS